MRSIIIVIVKPEVVVGGKDEPAPLRFVLLRFGGKPTRAVQRSGVHWWWCTDASCRGGLHPVQPHTLLPPHARGRTIR